MAPIPVVSAVLTAIIGGRLICRYAPDTIQDSVHICRQEWSCACTGLLSFPLTPFTPDDEVDLAVLAEHVAQQIAPGRRRCSSPAAPASSPRCGLRRVPRRGRAPRSGWPPAGCRSSPAPAAGRRMAREFAGAAAERGADGLLLLPPYLVASTPAGLVRHVRYVAGATRLPIIVYQRANAVLDPAAARRAARRARPSSGIKDGRGRRGRDAAAGDRGTHQRAPARRRVRLPQRPADRRAVACRRTRRSAWRATPRRCCASRPDIATAFYRAIEPRRRRRSSRALLAEFYLPFVGAARPGARVRGGAWSRPARGWPGLADGPVRPPLVDASPEHVEQLAAIIAAAGRRCAGARRLACRRSAA